jgi:effector-binding domain-containing protein
VPEVKIERTTEHATAVIKAETTRQEFPTLWGPLLDEVWAFLRATPGLRSDGHNVMLYRHNVPGVEVAVEVGVQVTRRFEPAGRVVASTLPSAEVATTIHTAGPSSIGAAYEAIEQFCKAANRRLIGVSWEIYGDPGPDGDYDVAVHSQLA